MSRLIAYVCNDDSLTPVVFQQLAPELAFEDVTQSSGIGFGWVQDGRSLLRTIPRPTEGTARFEDMFADIPSRSLIGHYRAGELGPVNTLDLQPFRFRKWVFAHDGEVPELRETLDELLESVPQFIRSNLKGTHPAEVIFHTFLAELQERNLLERGRQRPEGCAEALAAAMVTLETRAALADARAFALTERMVVAGRMGEPLYYKMVRGLEQKREKPLFAGHSPKPVRHPSFKAIVITDAVAPDAQDWQEVPDRHVLWLDRDWNVHFHAM